MVSKYVRGTGKTGRVNSTRHDRMVRLFQAHIYWQTQDRCSCRSRVYSLEEWQEHISRVIEYEFFGGRKPPANLRSRAAHKPSPYQVTLHRIKGEPLCRDCRIWLDTTDGK